MIPQQVLENISEVIDWHRTWIKVKDYGTLEEFVIENNNSISRTVMQTFRLEVRIHNNGLDAGSILSIPFSDLESAIQRFSSNNGFKRRLDSFQLTYEDVNQIFHYASLCQLDLELE